jgi:hypothetical protein
MKESCLLVLIIRHIEIPQITSPLAMLLIFLKNLLMSRGALSWFHNVSTYGGNVIEY